MNDFTITLNDGTTIRSTPIGDDGYSNGPFHAETDETGIGLYWATGWNSPDRTHVNTRTRFITWQNITYLDRPNGPTVKVEQ